MRQAPLVAFCLKFHRQNKSYKMADEFEMDKNVNGKDGVQKHFGFVQLTEGDVIDR